MTRILSKLALMVLAATIAGQAQAHTKNRFAYKSPPFAPFAVPHTHVKDGYTVRSLSDCPRTLIIRGSGKGATTYVCSIR